ncbi:hypothetical protein F5880DRAFT_1492359, partial [Lentinula raphanica]
SNFQPATLPTHGRPAVIAWWFRNRKPVYRSPPADIFGTVDDFASQWWTWWSDINPTWRQRHFETGRVILAPDSDDQGEWKELLRPGQCGMFSVLMTLFWWNQHLSSPSSEWTAALQDVTWVFEELVQHTE